ncbi:MAG: hypothetical protein AABW49_00390 [Nanoarchaeota archaeon]
MPSHFNPIKPIPLIKDDALDELFLIRIKKRLRGVDEVIKEIQSRYKVFT